MTNIATNGPIATADRGGLIDRLIGGFVAVRDSIRDAMAYRNTLEQLQGLSDHELDDLGIQRHDLHRVAYESVYGA